MTEILTQVSNYLISLDWAYILTFIIITYGLNHYKTTSFFRDLFKISIPTRYRVLIIGLLYGVTLYFIRNYTVNKIECLVQSFVFALVFHKLILETLLEKLLPNQN